MDQNTATPEIPPENTYAAADWLLRRHDWPRQLVTRVIGYDPLADEDANWLDDIVDVMDELRQHDAEWAEYARTTREPSDEEAWEAWRAAGPQPTPRAYALDVMSASERHMIRLVATFRPDGDKRPPWALSDLSRFDSRSIDVVLDWVRVILHNLSYAPAAKASLEALLALPTAEGRK